MASGLKCQTANLVLTSENRRRDVGPSSEVESLTAKKDARSIMKEMGSRVSFSKPTDGAAEAKKKRLVHVYALILLALRHS